jgi:hypothetical protein
MIPARRDANTISRQPLWSEGEPLWKIVPQCDESGRPCNDFMMLAPGLNKRPMAEIQATLQVIHSVLGHYGRWVLFANFNLKLNLLWVSLRQRPGAISEIAAVLHARLPRLKLIGHHTELGK